VRSFLARDDGFMKMFIDEARVASRLNHANVVQIFDFAKHDESYFIAMEYVRGVSLWDLRRRCRELGIPLPTLLAAEIAMHVARGLHYAHSLTDKGRPLGLVHRDVTPHNVLLSFDGAVKLTDFGIAKASGNQMSTAAGMLKGKFAYMSPEQAGGDPLDSRTDVFALGIVLWEMLTGGRLFEGDSDVAVLRAVRESYISPPARLNPDVPAELDGIVMKALTRELNGRYQSAQELERALANFVLRNAKAVEDTSVGMFVSQMFRDELEELREAENAGGTQTTAKSEPRSASSGQAPPLPAVDASMGPGETAIVQRDHSGEKPKTKVMPGARPRGPLEDEDDASQQRTDQMSELSTERPPTAQMKAPDQATPPRVIASDSLLKEMEEASKQLLAEEAQRQRTTESVPRTSPKPKDDLAAAVPIAAQKSLLPWVVTALASVGFIGGLGYMVMFRGGEAPAVQVVAAVPVPKSEPKVEAPPAPTPAPERVVEKAPEPEPAHEVPAAAPVPVEKPVENGWLDVDATPYATVTINGRKQEAQGKKRIALAPGTYQVLLEHPKRRMTKTVKIESKKPSSIVFRAFEPEP
jgi:serine/threonine-protein kinase